MKQLVYISISLLAIGCQLSTPPKAESEKKLPTPDKMPFEAVFSSDRAFMVKHYLTDPLKDSAALFYKNQQIYAFRYLQPEEDFFFKGGLIEVKDNGDTISHSVLSIDSCVMITLTDVNYRCYLEAFNLKNRQRMKMDNRPFLPASSGSFYFRRDKRLFYVLQSFSVDKNPVNVYELKRGQFHQIGSFAINGENLTHEQVVQAILARD